MEIYGTECISRHVERSWNQLITRSALGHNTGSQPLNKCMKTFANKCMRTKALRDITKSNPAKEILVFLYKTEKKVIINFRF